VELEPAAAGLVDVLEGGGDPVGGNAPEARLERAFRRLGPELPGGAAGEGVSREAEGPEDRGGLAIGVLLAYSGKRLVASLIPGLPVQSAAPIVFARP